MKNTHATDPNQVFDEAASALRRIEAEMPHVPHFDFASLPAREQGETDLQWRGRHMLAMTLHVLHVVMAAPNAPKN